jgi:hypothetical protein
MLVTRIPEEDTTVSGPPVLPLHAQQYRSSSWEARNSSVGSDRRTGPAGAGCHLTAGRFHAMAPGPDIAAGMKKS